MTAMRKAHVHLLGGVCLALVLAGVLQAQGPPGQDRVRVIIGFRNQPGAGEQALIRGAGGTVRHTYWLVPAIAAEVPGVALQGLRNNPNVTNVDLDVEVHAIDAELDASWGVKHIGSGIVHDAGNKGAGVKVCVIDSGVDYTRPDLAANYGGGWDFVNDDADPFDDRGHGTHVAGTISPETTTPASWARRLKRRCWPTRFSAATAAARSATPSLRCSSASRPAAG